MRRLSLASLALLGPLLSQTILARSIAMRADPPGLPECAKPCFKPAVEATGCPQSDNACICDSQIYWQRMLSCTFMGCRFEDNAALLDFGLTFCNRKRTSTNSAQRLDGAAAVAPPPEDPTTPAVSQETPTKAVPSGQFTVEQPSSKTESSNSDILVIQTANPSTGAAKGQVTDAPARTSAPPAATADEPSSASAGALHLFNQSSFASFLLCLLALFFVF